MKRWTLKMVGISLLMTFCLTTFLVTSAVASDPKPVKLTMFVFAAPGHKDIPREVVDAYMKKNPHVKVEIVESSNSKVFPQMLAAYQTTPDDPYIDFGYFNLRSHTKGAITGMWDTIDAARVPNMENVYPQFREPENRGVGFSTGLWGLLYNTKYVKQPPNSYSELWSSKYKGKLTIWDYTWNELVMAARLNGGGEKNIDPGFKLWSDNVDQLHSLHTSNEALKNLMVTGEVWISLFDLQQARIWREKEGAPVGGVIPKEGAIAWPLYLDITKGLKPEQKKVAEELVNLLLAPETLAKYADTTYYVPTASGVKLTEKLKALPIFDPEQVRKSILLDWVTITENIDEWSKRWDREVKRKMR